MAYRKRTRFSKKLQAAMQRGRERARMERPAPDYMVIVELTKSSTPVTG